MHPSFGVPWPRLERAAARLTELHAGRAEPGRVSALIFLGGVKYLLTYREANQRRLSHYLDDGLREAADHTLPALMKCCREFPAFRAANTRTSERELNLEFAQLAFGFSKLHRHLPATTVTWLASSPGEINLLRLTFGLGVVARFAPDSYDFLRRMLAKPMSWTQPVADVLESFCWHPDWSVALAA